ncbi:MAG: hypothetical protein AABW58_00635 [Nanoarchaeota archaeon]
MSKKSVLILVVLLSLFIVGCQTNTKKDKTASLGIFIGGSDALDFSFIESQPPNKVLDNLQEPFFIGLRLQNKGEYEIPSNKIIASLSGINQEAFSLSSLNTKLKIPLEGKAKSGDQIIESSPEELLFDQLNYKHDLNADFPTSLRVDVCYEYKTKSVSKVCLKKKAVEKTLEDKCNVLSDSVATETSSAPVQIKDVKQRSSAAQEIKLTFKIVNVGKGDIYPPSTFSEKCTDVSAEKNKIQVLVTSPSSKVNIKCSQLQDSNKGITKLALGEKTISCDIPTSDLQETAFEEPVSIELFYFYKGSIEKQITVLNSEE